MSENDQASQYQSPVEDTAARVVETSTQASSPTIRQRVVLFLLRVAAVFAAFLLFVVLLTGGAGWYTSRPQFCNSCHIMKPYYVSWEESSHKDVACVKCHFPPGVGEKVRGKLLGLVQLAKYVTASEGPRPAAEIPDASCLRSGCHETRLLAGRVDFHGIPFDHTPHLEGLRRGKQVRCTSCHSQIVQGAHMTVTASTCYLCHFKGQFFNEGLGSCTRCHQIPEEEFDLGGGVKFHHDLAYETGVDCGHCHGDLIQGSGEVPSERCSVCHNREDDLKRINDGAFLHKTHVTDHKVDCLACHLEIHHSLDPHKLVNAASDCKSCHPNHHHEQIAMLQGVGARSISAQPNAMAVARIACPSCHREKDISLTGTVLMKASMQTCAMCHDEAEIADIKTYHEQLGEAISKLVPDFEQIRRALQSADLDDDRKAILTSQLDGLQHDVNFLHAANDIHNGHYASTLASTVVEQLSSICRELKITPPAVELPETPVGKQQ